MFSLPGFKVRNPIRDNETDMERVQRIEAVIRQIIGEVNAEKQGLERRYHKECMDAGFLVAAIENEGGSSQLTKRWDHLTSSILYCERRLEKLSRQGTLLEKSHRSLDRYVADEWPG